MIHKNLEYLPLSEGYLEFVRVCRNYFRFRLLDNRKISSQQQRDWFSKLNREEDKYFVVKEGETLIGFTSCKIDKRQKNAEVGIILDKDQCHKGYGHKIIQFLKHYGFEKKKLNRLWITVLETNKDTLFIWERAGWKREGVLREACYTEGKFVDIHVAGILRKDV